jgi:putative membrane protein
MLDMKALPVLGAALFLVACGDNTTSDTPGNPGNMSDGAAATNTMDAAGMASAGMNSAGMDGEAGVSGNTMVGATQGMSNSVAGTNGVSQTAPGSASVTDTNYVAMAGASDQWEIESSRAVLAKSKNTEVVNFAQMMIDHHTGSSNKIKAAARTANITPPAPKMDAQQQRMLDEIKNADAASVDAVYLRHQRAAHEKALSMHQNYALNGENSALKQAASEIAPVVENHIAALTRLPGAS